MITSCCTLPAPGGGGKGGNGPQTRLHYQMGDRTNGHQKAAKHAPAVGIAIIGQNDFIISWLEAIVSSARPRYQFPILRSAFLRPSLLPVPRGICYRFWLSRCDYPGACPPIRFRIVLCITRGRSSLIGKTPKELVTTKIRCGREK